MESEAKIIDALERITSVLAKLERKVSGDEHSFDEGSYDVDPELHRKKKELESKMIEQLENLEPLTQLLKDPTVNDILVNGTKNIYVERSGKLVNTGLVISDDSQIIKIANQIVETIGRKLDKRRPLVDARLLDGSRVNVIAPPLAVDGTSISIRKFSQRNITLDSMIEQNNVSRALGEVLKICGGSRLNVVISGGTGSGKTTLLNAISNYISPDERLVTIEDAAELKLQQPHIVRLETKPLELGHREEEVTIRDLVKNALRMRPDRIIVGEVRGPEAFDMMQAMNTGHEGSMTTIHANHPRDALSRLENMVMMANLGIPMKSIRYQIASAINVIVQVSRMRDGHRRITHVSEIVGMEGDTITMQDLFNFVPDGTVDKDGKLNGKFKWTGIVPRFVRRVAYWGYQDQLSKALGIELPKM